MRILLASGVGGSVLRLRFVLMSRWLAVGLRVLLDE
jgi:hypothetical protein